MNTKSKKKISKMMFVLQAPPGGDNAPGGWVMPGSPGEQPPFQSLYPSLCKYNSSYSFSLYEKINSCSLVSLKSGKV